MNNNEGLSLLEIEFLATATPNELRIKEMRIDKIYRDMKIWFPPPSPFQRRLAEEIEKRKCK